MIRKRIRVIDQNYHCSIIGTCLTHKEVREILESSYRRDFSHYADHDLHSMAVGGARELSRFSNRLTEKLNKKYYAAIFKASHTLNTGDLALKLSSRISKITAIDHSWKIIKIAQGKMKKRAVENVSYTVQDVCKMDYLDQSFDNFDEFIPIVFLSAVKK